MRITVAAHLRFVLGPFLMILALACDDAVSPEGAPDSTAVPSPFMISPADFVIHVPRSTQLTTSRGRDTTVVTWASSDTAVATVSASGVLSARFPGLAVVTARRGGQLATTAVTVTATTIAVDSSILILDLNDTRQLTATVRDEDGETIRGVPVTWEARDSSIASVGASSGLVRGLSAGTTSITASGGGRISATVWVHVDFRPGASLVFSQIASTANFACGLEAGTRHAHCWGDNHAGALGSASTGERPAPVGGGRRFNSISVGNYGTCALEDQTELAYCWGSNREGDLGDGTRTTRWEPVLVANGRIRFSSISAGGGLTCGVEAETALGYCWGMGGLIGDGTLAQRSTPTLVDGGNRRFSTISVSTAHACGIELQTASLYCWGSNEFGVLGDGTTTDRLRPTLIADSGLRFRSIDADYRMTCGIEAPTGIAYCWGSNENGQVGDGTRTVRMVPTRVDDGKLRFGSIDTGGQVSCGVEAGTGVGYCWGRNDIGQVGDGTTTDRTRPTLLSVGAKRFSSLNAALCCTTYGVEAKTGVAYWWGYGTTVPTMMPTR